MDKDVHPNRHAIVHIYNDDHGNAIYAAYGNNDSFPHFYFVPNPDSNQLDMRDNKSGSNTKRDEDNN